MKCNIIITSNAHNICTNTGKSNYDTGKGKNKKRQDTSKEETGKEQENVQDKKQNNTITIVRANIT